jgi:hypothetical protein
MRNSSMQRKDNQGIKIVIQGEVFVFSKPYYLVSENLRIINPRIKGSQLVWYVNGVMIAYKDLRKYITKECIMNL